MSNCPCCCSPRISERKYKTVIIYSCGDCGYQQRVKLNNMVIKCVKD